VPVASHTGNLVAVIFAEVCVAFVILLA
jgi:hypothetical protein